MDAEAHDIVEFDKEIEAVIVTKAFLPIIDITHWQASAGLSPAI